MPTDAFRAPSALQSVGSIHASDISLSSVSEPQETVRSSSEYRGASRKHQSQIGRSSNPSAQTIKSKDWKSAIKSYSPVEDDLSNIARDRLSVVKPNSKNQPAPFQRAPSTAGTLSNAEYEKRLHQIALDTGQKLIEHLKHLHAKELTKVNL